MTACFEITIIPTILAPNTPKLPFGQNRYQAQAEVPQGACNERRQVFFIW